MQYPDRIVVTRDSRIRTRGPQAVGCFAQLSYDRTEVSHILDSAIIKM